MAVFEFLAGKEEDLILPLLQQSPSLWRGKKRTEKHDSLEGVLRNMEFEKM